MLLSSPFGGLHEFQRALESMFDGDWLSSTPSASGPFPPLNVFRKGDEFLVIAELPGVRKADIQVQIKQNTLRISGSKRVEYPEKGSVHRAERSAGEFDRVVSIPVQVDPEGVKAEYRDGVLALLVPRAESDKPKTIKVA